MPIRLDQRLTAIANLTDYGRVADIGCDHGKLGYYLISTDRASFVIATDISALSLKKASELARENGVSHLMQTRLGDGLVPIKSGEVDTVIIAGLGGDVIKDIILAATQQGKEFDHFLLCANTHPEKVRSALAKVQHTIVVDEMIECANKVYTIIKSDKGESALDEMQIKFGTFFKTSDNFLTFANKSLEKMRAIYNQNPQSCELMEKIQQLEGAVAINLQNKKGK